MLSANSFSLEESKICRLEKVKPSPPIFQVLTTLSKRGLLAMSIFVKPACGERDAAVTVVCVHADLCRPEL